MLPPMAALPSNYGYDPGIQNLMDVRLICIMIEPGKKISKQPGH
jgi:hypothetical protein